MKRITSLIYDDKYFLLTNIISVNKHNKQLVINYKPLTPKYTEWLCGKWFNTSNKYIIAETTTEHYFIDVNNVEQEIEKINILKKY